MSLEDNRYGSIGTSKNKSLDELQSSEPGHGIRSVFEVALNLVNATVGSGIIGLPFALMLSGFSFGILISIWISVLTFAAVYSLILSGQKTHIYSFPSLAQLALGQFGFYMLNIMLFIQSAGSAISYFILLADTIPILLGFYIPQYPILGDRFWMTIFISVVIVFPLNVFRSIGAIARWSAFSVFLLPIMVISILVRAPTYAGQHESPLFEIGKDPIAAMAIMSFAFVCSQVAFPNYLSQKNQSLQGWRWTTILCTTLSWVMSISFAATGYLSFGKDVSSNIFSNFPEDDLIINIGRLALGISMIFTVPMGIYPARDAFQKTVGFETKEKQPTDIQHYMVTVILYVVFLAFGVKVRSLGKVYSVVGGVASSFIAYIIPGLSYITAFHPEWISSITRKFKGPSEDTQEAERLISSNSSFIANVKSIWWLDIASILLVIFGIIVMFYTLLSPFFQ